MSQQFRPKRSEGTISFPLLVYTVHVSGFYLLTANFKKSLFNDFKSAYNSALFGVPTRKNVALISIFGNYETKCTQNVSKRKKRLM